MKFRKAMSGFLLLTVLSVSGTAVFANDTEDVKITKDSEGIILISKELDVEENQSYFNSFTGLVKEINDFHSIEGAKIVFVENEDGSIANIIISEDTHIVDADEIVEGSTITGFYKADAPMIMIYPAQYNAKVVAVENKDQNIKVDQFNKDLISADNQLKLNISEETEIISEDGKFFEGELENKKLVVTYDISTRSIPAQTNPIKIVVLNEDKEDAITDTKETQEESIEFKSIDVSNTDIIVEDKKIEAPTSYVNEQGTVMVPLRAIAEALEFDVEWNGEEQSVKIGKNISLTIGEDNYIDMKAAPIKLGSAPELVDDRTFVPLSFFREVVGLNNAYLHAQQIIINDGEKME